MDAVAHPRKDINVLSQGDETLKHILEDETNAYVEGVSVNFEVIPTFVLLVVVLDALCETEVVTGTDHNCVNYDGRNAKSPLSVNSLESRIGNTLAEHITAYSKIEAWTCKCGETEI